MIFLAYTLFFLIANACFATMIWASIQQDQWMDKLFGWQKMIHKIGSKPGFVNEFLYKNLGGCEFCFSHFITMICFVFYCLFMNHTIGWFSINGLTWAIIGNITWYLVYDGIGTLLSFLIITKLLGHDKE